MRELKAAAGNLGEVAAYAQQFVEAKVSGVAYMIRKVVMMAVLGVVAGLAGVSIVVTAAALLVIGLGQAIATIMPAGFAWAGNVIVGLLGVIISAGGAWLIVRRAAAAGREAAAQHYRERLQEQRKNLGIDAMTRVAQHEQRTGKSERKHQDSHPADVSGDAEALRNE